MCHLEDGNHFGEVALLMKDSKRVATVVAVENTQLYRLDALDFKCVTMRIVLTIYKARETGCSLHTTTTIVYYYRKSISCQHNKLFKLSFISENS